MAGKAESEKARKARLAAELRANLQRRKAQARARRAGAADARDGDLDAAGTGRDQERGAATTAATGPKSTDR